MFSHVTFLLMQRQQMIISFENIVHFIHQTIQPDMAMKNILNNCTAHTPERHALHCHILLRMYISYKAYAFLQQNCERAVKINILFGFFYSILYRGYLAVIKNQN